jgi:mRNA interferase MazF
MSYPQRGSVYLVNFDPTIGSEIKKTRPAVIISNNIANRYSPIVTVAAVTSRAKPKFDEVFIEPPEGGLTKSSVILPNQVRSIDKARLVKKLGQLSDKTLRELDIAIKITLGLIKF